MIWVPKVDGNPAWAAHINDLQNEKVDSDGTASPSFIHAHLTVAPGTAPLVVTSPTMVANLNADLLDGNHAAAFAAVAHNHDADYISIIAAPAVNHFPYQTAGGELIDSTYAAGDFALVAHTHDLDDLADVNAGAPNDDDFLSWDAGSGMWIPVAGGGGGAHDLLSATHGDTLADGVEEGDLMVGNSTPKWSRLAHGSEDEVLTVKSGVLSWEPAAGGAMALDDLTDVDAAAPNDNDIIRFDSGSGLWKHEALPAGGGGDFLVCQVFS